MITQEERLDLTDIKEEKEAYTKSIMDALKDKEIEKGDRDYILKANCDLMAENQRLKEQLDREIKINRKMKKALEDYANHDNWYNSLEWNTYDKQGWETAEETLKEIDNEE